jgi:hypothetical protein
VQASGPKTSRSRRLVALTKAAVNVLRQHRAAQAEERLHLGAAREDKDLALRPHRSTTPGYLAASQMSHGFGFLTSYGDRAESGGVRTAGRTMYEYAQNVLARLQAAPAPVRERSPRVADP